MTLDEVLRAVKKGFTTARFDHVTNIRDVEDVVLSEVRDAYGEEEEYEGWAEEDE